MLEVSGADTAETDISNHGTEYVGWMKPCACPTNDISIKFEIRPKFAVLSINVLNRSQQKFASREDFVAIGGAYFKLKHSKI